MIRKRMRFDLSFMINENCHRRRNMCPMCPPPTFHKLLGIVPLCSLRVASICLEGAPDFMYPLPTF